MNPIPGLERERDQARRLVRGKTFDQAPEVFKDIESAKARIRYAKRIYRKEKQHAATQERHRA
ncbi:hypothetical protein LQ772_06745 [Frateuria edaphi]|uniref:hypothetical protein n=1 Tax=Frateuria edaphi TaxID=2898793 RepID=UPI001E4ED290|nr:hypothetical protein [Frateuria edaphi]UGB46983.1 hypothetical protein LQ772_06745 [Frateuria edaphi]